MSRPSGVPVLERGPSSCNVPIRDLQMLFHFCAVIPPNSDVPRKAHRPLVRPLT
jgi:hypothetical protein